MLAKNGKLAFATMRRLSAGKLYFDLTPRKSIPDTDPIQSPLGEENGTPVTVIADRIAIGGNFSTPGDLDLFGEVTGDVSCRRLIINPAARIQGNVYAEDVIVDGALTGSIWAQRVELCSNSRVLGPIFCNSFRIGTGAFFEGGVRRVNPAMNANYRASRH